MRNSWRFGVVVLVVFTAACATTTDDWTARAATPARDAPAQFVTADGSLPENACRSPLTDPRDDTRIRLIRSGGATAGEVGDYEVPGGRYGVGAGQLLRIDCSTGRPLGVVAR